MQDASNGGVLLDVGGVGYELAVPLGTLGRVGVGAEGRVVLQVHTHVREGSIELFGFATQDDRTVFRTLLTIAKVGPKLALAILSGVTIEELAQVVESGHAARLTKVPGVGKKTAERIVLELKGKLNPGSAVSNAVAVAQAARRRGQPPDPNNVVQQTLVSLGFKPGDVDRALASMDDLSRPIDELVREALRHLAP